MDAVGIRLCGGPLAVTRGGAAVTVPGRKSRLLLARLAAAGGQALGSGELAAVLWPGRPPARPADNVATLVSRLRAALGPDVIVGGRDGYRVGPPPAVVVDLAEARDLSAEAARRLHAADPGLAAAAARRGADLLTAGRVLVGEPDDGWVTDVRAEAAALLRTLRHLLAEAAPAAGDPAAGVAAARAAAVADPLDERAHRLLMAAHHAAGEPDRALAVFERLRRALAGELGVDPDAETRALHVAVLRHQQQARRVPTPAAPRRAAPAGRDDELARLTAAWSGAAGGTVAAVLVAGEAGIGKTTLAEAAAAVAADTGGLVLRARCYSAERSLFLQPVLDALVPTLHALPAAELRRLAGPGAGALAALVPEAAAALGEPDPVLGDPEAGRRRAYEAVRGFLAGLAADRPVLLLLDDLHNAGVATVELLHFLVRRTPGARLLVLATVRTEEGAAALADLAEVAVRLDVGPLPPAAVALLAARAGAPRLAEDILRRTRGHTLFVVETLRALSAGGSGVPESLQAAVLSRLRHVGPDVERVLRAGAVLGAAVPPDLVATLLDLPTPVVALRCEQAAAARLLAPAGAEYEFANDLLQEVLYATTSEPVRVAHHRRAADLLTDRPEARARHAEALGDRVGAARAWLTAGERAVQRFASADARTLLDRALAAADPAEPALTGRIHLVRAQAREGLAEFEAAADDLRAALAAAQAAGDRRLEMTVLGHHAREVGAALELPERERQLERGARMAVELSDSAAQADLFAWQAIVAANRLRFTDAIALGRRAVAAGRAAGTDEALAAGLDGLKTAYAYLGDSAELHPVLVDLEPLLHRLGSLQILYWTVFESALPCVGAADWDGAAERMDRALVINRRSGMRAQEAWLTAHRGWMERLRGCHDAAVEWGRRAVELARASPHHWWRPTANALLAATLLEVDEPDQAIALLVEAREVAERGGVEAYVLRAVAPLAEATGSTETLAAADRLLAGIRAPAGSAWLAGADAYLAVARAWMRHGEAARARDSLAPLLAAAARAGWLPVQAAGALVEGTALAALGDPDGAGRRFRLAAALGERHGMPHLAERARAAAG